MRRIIGHAPCKVMPIGRDGAVQKPMLSGHVQRGMNSIMTFPPKSAAGEDWSQARLRRPVPGGGGVKRSKLSEEQTPSRRFEASDGGNPFRLGTSSPFVSLVSQR